jgi:hypothetical protein
MAKQTINIGASPNDGTGTPLRTAFDYCNLNFTELYTATGPSGNNIVVPGSATITGDLTVDTNTLYVKSSTNQVGIGTTSPNVNFILDLTSSNDARARQWFADVAFVGTGDLSTGFQIRTLGTGTNGLKIANSGNTVEWLRIDSTGVHSWQNVGGVAGTAMTLNSTGLGVGTTPTVKIDALTAVVGNSNALTIGNNEYGGTTYLNTNSVSLTFNRGQSFKTGAIVSSNITSGNLSEGYIKFQTSTSNVLTDRMFIDNAGNVGVGVTPSAWAATFKAIDIGSGCVVSQPANQTVGIFANAFGNGTNYTRKATGLAAAYDIYNGAHYWLNAGSGAAGSTFAFGTAAMTLDASGNLSVGATAVLNSVRIFGQRSGGSVAGFNRTTSDGTNVLFYREDLIVGDVSVTTTGTTFNSTSDYRLKESVAPLSGGLARVNSLKPSIYKWKSNGSDGEGFLAHELAEVVPAAVSGQKDAVNEDGTIKAQSIDMSRIVPILVAAIQELTARVQTLEAR